MSVVALERRYNAWRRLVPAFPSLFPWQPRLSRGAAGILIAAMLLGAAVCAPRLAPQPYDRTDFASAWQFPSARHWMGTDGLGRDLLARVLYGGRISLAIAFSSQVMSLAVGLPLGAVAGWYGGTADYLIMRMVDVMSAIPPLLFAVLLMASLGSGPWQVALAIGATGWIRYCRVLRGQLLQLREAEYVTAARVLGVPPARIVWRHLLPNALTPLLVAVGLGIPFAIVNEAGLSFLGLGVNPPSPSWGQMVGDSIAYIPFYWHLALFPCLALGLATVSFTLAAGGLASLLAPSQGVAAP